MHKSAKRNNKQSNCCCLHQVINSSTQNCNKKEFLLKINMNLFLFYFKRVPHTIVLKLMEHTVYTLKVPLESFGSPVWPSGIDILQSYSANYNQNDL